MDDKERAIREAVKEAISELAGADTPEGMVKWAKYDSKTLVAHCMGSCHAQFRIDNIEIKNDNQIMGEILRQVVRRIRDEE